MTDDFIDYSAVIAAAGKVRIELHVAALWLGRGPYIQKSNVRVRDCAIGNYCAFASTAIVILSQKL